LVKFVTEKRPLPYKNPLKLVGSGILSFAGKFTSRNNKLVPSMRRPDFKGQKMKLSAFKKRGGVWKSIRSSLFEIKKAGNQFIKVIIAIHT
jgi:hypothetical protein